jgi:PST family polysaccharide transporter
MKYIKVNTKEKKQLIENIGYLAILQGANYILPLMTLTYLVRVLGPDYFGLIAFSSAVIAYFGLISDYGFNLSATQQVSINRNNNIKLTEIFSSVITVKFLLTIACFFLMSFIVIAFEKFREYWEVYFLTFGTIIGQMLFPIWLFQGMERMRYITYLNIGAKLFFTFCIFIFVNKQEDYLLVPLFNSMGFVISGIFSMYIARKYFNVKFIFQPMCMLKYQIVEGWHVFFSSVAISFYTVTSTIILGLFTNNSVVGFYSAADKIVQAVKGLYAPVSQAIYPLIVKKIHENKKSGLEFIQKVTRLVGFIMFILSAILYFSAEKIVLIVLGENFNESVLILQVMSFLPFIISLSNIYGIQTMLNLGYKHAFSRILISAAILGVGLSLIIVPKYKGLGTAVVVVIVEIFVTILMYSYLKLKAKRNQ